MLRAYIKPALYSSCSIHKMDKLLKIRLVFDYFENNSQG
ncbi:uncharacterized protein METZ01_LOCUS45668 [marine metagenome]|uniref:Uncharacterized protein n=1 Tax=marine metagenome TaxID=408172 RepID=A0A381RNI3_9ZZZZ